MADPGRGLLGPRFVAAVLVLGAIGLVVSALGIARGGGYSVIGPATIPLVVATGLLVLGALFAVRTTVRPDEDLARQAAEEESATHWPTVGLVGAVLVAYALALDGVRLGPLDIPGLGYPLATGLFLPAVARTLGSRALLRDVIAGVGLALAVYFGFTQFLGVRLPPGVLDFVLP
ncbi:MAG TPA: tripartite tricarboxylate transporter TctB family protein [Candidatus Limnocylindria bacterium]|nr:tripartite tricarboxylate transporter TctB family protein [Candidatus Limnocylindria bacterium]